MVVAAQDCDDLIDAAQFDVHALPDDLRAAAAGHSALHPGQAMVQQRGSRVKLSGSFWLLSGSCLRWRCDL